MNRTGDKFVAYTGKNFQLFDGNNLELLKTFQAEMPVVPVVFGESEKIVVGGTDRGCAIVFDTNSEELLQKLEYPCSGLVQPVSVSFDVLIYRCLLKLNRQLLFLIDI